MQQRFFLAIVFAAKFLCYELAAAQWISQTSGTNQTLLGVSFTSANVGIAVGVNGLILRTTNGGNNWNSQMSGVTSDLYSVHFTDHNNGAAVGQLGRILRTTNGGGTTKVDEKDSAPPDNFGLEQNYPNPFNPTTKIRYHLPGKRFVALKVFDVRGHEVATLVNALQPAGTKEIIFDASLHLAGGIYFYRLTVGNFSASKKMLLVE